MSSYIPHLIGNYNSGLDNSVQPWLLPDDAQESLFDGFVYRGVWFKRPGYDQFAIGGGGAAFVESRIVSTTTSEAYGTGSGITGPYTHTAAHIPVARGTITITAGAQSAVDDGNGNFITTPAGGTGTVNYTTGAMSITFNGSVAGATPITVTYSVFPGLPVMMVANFYNSSNTRQLVVADSRNINRYNGVTNRLVDITGMNTFTGGKFDFFSWVNYPDASDNPRLLFSNGVDPIKSYDGTTVITYVFTLTGVTTLSARLMFQLKDRLILLRTVEDGTTFGKRIRISGTGANCDVFDSTATGAGLIEIPDNSWIMAAAFNRDDLVIFTEQSTWVLQFTGSDVTPFQLTRLDSSRGSQAPFSGITYLNKTTTVSPLGVIATDGYRVERTDDKIPEYSFDSIDQENFALCFAGAVDEDRDHYLIHPAPQSSTSDTILVTNYEEFNYSVYRIALSCMGNFIEQFDITWNDLLAIPNWDQFANQYGSWEDFDFMKGLPFAIGGGQNGQIWRMNVNGIEDNPVRIFSATVIDSHTLEVTTQFNNFVIGDYIYLNGMTGMEEGNDKQGAITSIPTANYTFRLDMPTERFSTYTQFGFASRVIPFESKTKKFNPFANKAAKVRCGYMYMYVVASDTGLTRNVDIFGITKSNPVVVTATNHEFSTGDLVSIFGAAGMTEINGQQAEIIVIDQDTFSMDGIDSTAYSTYTSGGVAAGPENCFIDIEVITNDENDVTQVEDSSLVTYEKPYRINCTPNRHDEGSKRWVKIYINQTARFLQFKLTNEQALSKIQIQAMMPGFAPVGRLI